MQNVKPIIARMTKLGQPQTWTSAHLIRCSLHMTLDGSWSPDSVTSYNCFGASRCVVPRAIGIAPLDAPMRQWNPCFQHYFHCAASQPSPDNGLQLQCCHYHKMTSFTTFEVALCYHVMCPMPLNEKYRTPSSLYAKTAWTMLQLAPSVTALVP